MVCVTSFEGCLEFIYLFFVWLRFCRPLFGKGERIAKCLVARGCFSFRLHIRNCNLSARLLETPVMHPESVLQSRSPLTRISR